MAQIHQTENKRMTLKKENTYAIEAITPDELDALYNAILHVPLPYRRELYSLKPQIENQRIK